MALTLGEKVQRMREKMGWTRKELAERAGLHPSHIGLIERGGRTEVRPETLEKLAGALKVPLMYLMTDDPMEYLRTRQASMPIEEYRRYLQLSKEERLQYILDDVREKWGAEAMESVQQHPDFDMVVNPPAVSLTMPVEIQNPDGTTQEASFYGNTEYSRAVQLALRYNISGEELLMAVEFIYKLKEAGTSMKA